MQQLKHYQVYNTRNITVSTEYHKGEIAKKNPTNLGGGSYTHLQNLLFQSNTCKCYLIVKYPTTVLPANVTHVFVLTLLNNESNIHNLIFTHYHQWHQKLPMKGTHVIHRWMKRKVILGDTHVIHTI
jgi:hypothetical protein